MNESISGSGLNSVSPVIFLELDILLNSAHDKNNGDSGNILEVRDLRTVFFTSRGGAPAVDGVSFSVERGKTLGLVGESGCGKSVTALSLMRLVPDPPGKIVSGSIVFNGQDLLRLKEKQMHSLRGNRMSMVFQEPMTSLNPVFTVGEQIAETLRLHRGYSRREAWKQSVEMLNRVRIPEAESRAKQYPHQMSGGMRQRVMIAMALCCDPEFLIADEPTTALDVTVQARILKLMQDMKSRYGSSILFISHNLGVIARIADEVAVMYAGQIVEKASVNELFHNPLHPYTHGLLLSVPLPPYTENYRPLTPIRGTVPHPGKYPAGCRFHPRCSLATEKCREGIPELEQTGESTHQVRCFYWKKVKEKQLTV